MGKARFNPKARHKARYYTLQAIYQWQMTGNSVIDIEKHMQTNDGFAKNVDQEYFRKLLRGVSSHVAEIDNRIEPLIDRPFEQLDPIELALLRMGFFELIFCTDVPYKVVINEAVELAKQFGATDSHKYINGILDKAAPHLRKPN